MIDGKNVFDQPIKDNEITYVSTRKLLLVKEMIIQLVVYFRDYYKMIAMDLSKQQALDADPRAIQQTNFTANINRRH